MSDVALDNARASIASGLDRAVAKGKLTAEAKQAVLDRITTASDYREVAASASVIVEAVPERLELKQQILSVSSPR